MHPPPHTLSFADLRFNKISNVNKCRAMAREGKLLEHLDLRGNKVANKSTLPVKARLFVSPLFFFCLCIPWIAPSPFLHHLGAAAETRQARVG